MSKFVCCACGNVFDEEEIKSWVESHGFTYGGERWMGSPCCHENYVDAYECDHCGEIINTETYVEIEDKKYCWDCVTIKSLEEI